MILAVVIADLRVSAEIARALRLVPVTVTSDGRKVRVVA